MTVQQCANSLNGGVPAAEISPMQQLATLCSKANRVKIKTAICAYTKEGETHTRAYRINPLDKSGVQRICNNCYIKIHSEIDYQNGVVCANSKLKGAHGGGRFRADPFDTTRVICGNCYKKALNELQIQNGRVCAYETPEKKHKGYFRIDPTDPDKKRTVCYNCFQTAKNTLDRQKGIVCFNATVEKKHFGHLYKNPNNKEQNLCRPCFEKERDDALRKKGIRCFKATDDTPHNAILYHHPTDETKTQWLCRTCLHNFNKDRVKA